MKIEIEYDDRRFAIHGGFDHLTGIWDSEERNSKRKLNLHLNMMKMRFER